MPSDDSNRPSSGSNEGPSKIGEQSVMNRGLTLVIHWLRGIEANSESRTRIADEAKTNLGGSPSGPNCLPSRRRSDCYRIECALDDKGALLLLRASRTGDEKTKVH